MCEKTVRRAVKDVLESLSKAKFEEFCDAILDRRDEPKVRTADLEGKSRLDVANILVSIFTESGVKDVVVKALGDIRCNEQRESFAKDIGEELLTRYGDIMKLETTGASPQTASQDNLDYTGRTASRAMAAVDLIEMKNYKTIIENVGRQKGLDPALIAAIISRSSRAGRTLTDGKGCFNEERQEYDTFGLMQINVNPKGGGHKPKGSWDSEEHLCQATDILLYFITRIRHKFPEWSKEMQLKGGIAAYNAGDLNILPDQDVDARTTNGDYSNDVIARAQWYKREAFKS